MYSDQCFTFTSVSMYIQWLVNVTSGTYRASVTVYGTDNKSQPLCNASKILNCSSSAASIQKCLNTDEVKTDVPVYEGAAIVTSRTYVNAGSLKQPNTTYVPKFLTYANEYTYKHLGHPRQAAKQRLQLEYNAMSNEVDSIVLNAMTYIQADLLSTALVFHCTFFFFFPFLPHTTFGNSGT